MSRENSPLFGKERPSLAWLDAAVMDKAYESGNIRRLLEHQGIEAVIPPRGSRKRLFPYDKEIPNASESGAVLWQTQRFRRIATHYDKLAKTFMVFVHLAAAFISFHATAPKSRKLQLFSRKIIFVDLSINHAILLKMFRLFAE